jgi:hypothetical protein
MQSINKLVLFIALLIATAADAQTCGNPGARLDRLRAKSLTKDSVYRWVKDDLGFVQIKNGDAVADIGSYDGYYPSIYSVFTDSVSFYLNDISRAGFVYFDSIRPICTEKRGGEISNSFKIVIGNDSSSNLPGRFFNKVILRDVLHHFKMMNKMLQDIKRILKSGADAKLFLFEPIRGETDMPNLCRGAMTRQELLALMAGNGFSLTKELPVQGNGCWFEFSVARE